MPSRPWGQGALSHTSNHGAGLAPVSDSRGTGVCQRHQIQISEQFLSSQQGLWVAGRHLLYPIPGLGILSAQKEIFRYSFTLKDLTTSLHGQDKHTLNYTRTIQEHKWSSSKRIDRDNKSETKEGRDYWSALSRERGLHGLVLNSER